MPRASKRSASAEENYLSACLSSGGDPRQHGLTPEMFRAYPQEMSWLLAYREHQGEAPTTASFTHRFPDFPLDTGLGQPDMKFFSAEMRTIHTDRMLLELAQDVANLVDMGDQEAALEAVSGFSPPTGPTGFTNDLEDFSLADAEFVDAMEVPWPTLQHHTSGMRRGDLWYVAARLGNGKSWTLAKLAAHAMRNGHDVSYYSLEMRREQVLTRMHVVLGAQLGIGVDHEQMRTMAMPREEYRLLCKRILAETPGRLHIHDSSMGLVSPATVAASPADLVLVDYAGLMITGDGRRAVDDWRGMAVISNQLKETAVAKDTRIVAAAQINRDGSSSVYPPKVENLAQSDALGQDADVVLTHVQRSRSVMHYSIEKNRHGSRERFHTNFRPNAGDFREIDRERAETIADTEDE